MTTPRATTITGAAALSPLDHVLNTFGYEGPRNRKQYQCLCPAHEDRNPSLSVSIGDDGRVLLHCFAGCELGAILRAVGLSERDLFPTHINGHPAPPAKPKPGPSVKPRIVATYDYKDAAGGLLFQVVRKEPGKDGKDKDFVQRRPDGNGGWLWKMQGVDTVLYRLPELLNADPARPVFVVEGEKDTDRLTGLRLIATTSPGGAKAEWKPNYTETLAGRVVYIIPDNDPPGRAHVLDIARQLVGIAAQVKIVDLPGLPPKGDISDWLDAGGTLEALRELIDATPEYSPSIEVESQNEDESPEPNPLDITPPADLALGWIDEYARTMADMTASPLGFNRLGALATVATAIQRRARVRMSFGDIWPNIYGAIIAPSSVYHKTTSMQKVRSQLHHAMLDRLVLSEQSTSEGLIKELGAKGGGLILRDEIGQLFDSHNTRYLRGLKPDLTALYDCLPYSRRLSQEEIKVESPYLSILGATTPQRFFESVTLTDWMDGFLARWLFVLPEGEPDFDAMTALYNQNHAAKMERLAAKLIEIDRQRETDFIFLGDAHSLWDTWQRQAAKQAYYFGDDITASIVTRYAAYALKFAIILTAVNGEWGRIAPETMQTAIDLADSYKANVNQILSQKENFGISGAKLQKVFKLIAHREGTGVTTRELLQAGNMKKHELGPCLEKLLEVGAVTRDPAGRGWRYFPAAKELPIKTWR